MATETPSSPAAPATATNGGCIVVIGGGQAGSELANELRQQGYAGRVVIVAEEPHLPYKRPPLSKAFLTGTVPVDQLHVRSAAMLERANVEVIAGARVTRIDREAKRIELADGRALTYDKLALTTGGRPRTLSTPGADKPNVHALRTIADAQTLQALLVEGRRLVIVGGGYIGLEVAAMAVKAGVHVTVLESAPRVLVRVTAPEISAFYERVHREAGVDLRTGVHIAAFEGEGRVTQVLLGDGSRIDTDAVIVGVGLIANTELAAEAGLAVDNGIVVDEFGMTSDPDIAAAGDCANRPSTLLGQRVRIESVQNAMEFARCAARSLLGQPKAYDELPWFWSDQYELKLQMCGLSGGYTDLVLRGSPETRSFAAFYLRDGSLIAADTVSRPQEFMIAKKLVAARARIAPQRLADETIPLKDLLAELTPA
ncbi:MAG: FAD-dependent oxidoreductase [Nevskia sp.]